VSRCGDAHEALMAQLARDPWFLTTKGQA
jgi:hypothetical protein